MSQCALSASGAARTLLTYLYLAHSNSNLHAQNLLRTFSLAFRCDAQHELCARRTIRLGPHIAILRGKVDKTWKLAEEEVAAGLSHTPPMTAHKSL